MALAPAPPAPMEDCRPQQLWLDVARPIQPRPPRGRGAQVRQAAPATGAQMELRMVAGWPAPARPLREEGHAAAAPSSAAAPLPPVDPEQGLRICFVTWLLRQVKSRGAIGELARAARADPLFPRRGNADDVRARFASVGADGDAYAALEDAERAYDRMA